VDYGDRDGGPHRCVRRRQQCTRVKVEESLLCNIHQRFSLSHRSSMIQSSKNNFRKLLTNSDNRISEVSQQRVSLWSVFRCSDSINRKCQTALILAKNIHLMDALLLFCFDQMNNVVS